MLDADAMLMPALRELPLLICRRIDALRLLRHDAVSLPDD